MSSRPILPPYKVITNGNMSGNITSSVTITPNLTLLSYQLSWAGTSPVGTAKVQISNDYLLNPDGSVENAGTWSDFPGASASISGNSGNGYFNLSNVGGYAIRLVYVFTSGVGSLQATINAKVQ